MTDTDERRVPGIKRVNVATLVEICGNQPGIPAFEAQSLDVSGRGMHVKTAYVPEVGDPLICRFENDGQEIVVEGVVAWRREGETGGDFGIEFTALDSSSVDALRALCGVAPPREAAYQQADEPRSNVCAAGAKVRLHIDGLGSPMKANVRDGGPRRVHVGSQLQFLQVGRHLEIEDVGAGARRNARIDSVDVRVDPRTQIPELVVALRYDGAPDTTPEPSVVDQSGDAQAAELEGARACQHTHAADEHDAQAREVEAEMLAEQKAAEQARIAYDRLGEAAEGARRVALKTGSLLSRMGQSAASGAGSLLRGASKQLGELRKQENPAPRKQTALPFVAGRRPPLGKLRPQMASHAGAARAQASQANRPATQHASPAPKKRPNKLALVAGALVVVGATTAYGLRDIDGPANAEPVAALAKPSKASAPAAKAAAKATSAKPAEDRSGKIVANVPLFGPTPMATMEPAPLGAAPDDESPEDEEAAEKAAAAAAVDDATWSESSESASPQDVKPWGRGRMHLPTIHKLRLDAPGGALSGSVNATGFTVVIPGRKVMESGRAIQRRDKRIAQVKTSNQAAGAHVTFQFRGKVPPYRVRLRKDFAEFLISAPSD